jgi:hypothetical protein
MASLIQLYDNEMFSSAKQTLCKATISPQDLTIDPAILHSLEFKNQEVNSEVTLVNSIFKTIELQS